MDGIICQTNIQFLYFDADSFLGDLSFWSVAKIIIE